MVFHILIREAHPDDASAVMTAIRSVMAEPDNNLNSTPDDFTTPPHDEHAFITRLAEEDNTLMLVAENFVHGEIVGVLTCLGDSRTARRHNARLGVLVTSPWRGRGIGKQLLREAIGWAQRHPTIRRLELEVLVRNTSAVALYQGLGFIVEGTARGAVFKRGFYMDTYYMALQLDGLPLVPSQPLVQSVLPSLAASSASASVVPAPTTTNQQAE